MILPLSLLLAFQAPARADGPKEVEPLRAVWRDFAAEVPPARGRAAGAAVAGAFSAPLLGPGELLNEIESRAVPLDWGSVLSGPEPVVILGETHDSRPMKESLLEFFSDRTQVQRSGLTHLSHEMFTDEIAELTGRLWQRGIAEDEDEFRRILEAWVAPEFLPGLSAETVFKALSKGLKLVTLELGMEERDSLKFRLSREAPWARDRAAQRRRYNAVREEAMAERIERALRPGGGAVDRSVKILVIVGASHGVRTGLPLQLARRGIACKSYAFLIRPDSIARPNLDPYYRALWAFGSRLTARPSFFTLPENLAAYDGFIVLPGEFN